jgi:hypothetical protein
MACSRLSRIVGVTAVLLALPVARPVWAAVNVKPTPAVFTIGPGVHEVTFELTPLPGSLCTATIDFGDGAHVTLKSGQLTTKHAYMALSPKTFYVKVLVGGGIPVPNVPNPCTGVTTTVVKAVSQPVIGGQPGAMVATPPAKAGGADTRTAIETPVGIPASRPPCQPPGCQQIVVEAIPATTGPDVPVAFKASGAPFGQLCKAMILFGDGKQEVMASGATATTASHAYQKPGRYTATVVCPLEKPVGIEVRSGSVIVTVQRGS